MFEKIEKCKDKTTGNTTLNLKDVQMCQNML